MQLTPGGSNYLIPTDGRNIEKPRATEYYLEVEKLIDILTDSNSRGPNVPVIAIFDCCRSEISAAAASGRTHLPTSKGGPSNVYVIYATADGFTASDGEEDGNGAFTQLLIKHMDMDEDIEEVSKAIRSELLTKSRRAQVCKHSNSIWNPISLV